MSCYSFASNVFTISFCGYSYFPPNESYCFRINFNNDLLLSCFSDASLFEFFNNFLATTTVSILCRAREMVAQVRTSKLFNGKIYAKSKPNSCVNDVSNTLDFEISMPFHDVMCDVKQVDAGSFSNDIIIQHHDMIVTTQDLGLSVHCNYDLSNRSISNINLEVDGYAFNVILLLVLSS